jgi:hypothetical protein
LAVQPLGGPLPPARAVSRYSQTGVGGRNKASSVIPIKMIQGVSTARKGVRFTAVVVATAGSSVEFHVVANDAENIKNTIRNLMLNGPAATPAPIAVHVAAPATSSPAPATTSSSLADELVKLVQLRDTGVLTPQEFHLQKARLLAG